MRRCLGAGWRRRSLGVKLPASAPMAWMPVSLGRLEHVQCASAQDGRAGGDQGRGSVVSCRPGSRAPTSSAWAAAGPARCRAVPGCIWCRGDGAAASAATSAGPGGCTSRDSGISVLAILDTRPALPAEDPPLAGRDPAPLCRSLAVPSAPAAERRMPGSGRPQRRGLRAGHRGGRPVRHRHLARAVRTRRRPHQHRYRPCLRGRHATARRLPRVPGHRRRLRCPDHHGAAACPRPGVTDHP